MEKKKGLKAVGIFFGTIIIAGIFIFGPGLLDFRDETKEEIKDSEIPVFSVKIAQAEKRTLRAFLDVNGEVTSSQQADAFPDMPGKLVKVNVTLGTVVRQGDVIAEVDSSKPGADFLNSPVIAPISGIVSKVPLSMGTTVNANTSIAAITAASTPEINVRIPEREIAGLRTGLRAEVTLQAYPGEIFTAAITHLAPVLDVVSRTKLITLKFDRNDNRINAGMFARVRINTRTYDDVLTIPAEAITDRYGEKTVYVPQGSASLTETYRVEARNVTIGVTINGRTEIKSGLAEDETVVVQGQQLLSGGEIIRIIGGVQ
jgi:multidrug efflux pump subunit AcrA (membrane-fusion protein)